MEFAGLAPRVVRAHSTDPVDGAVVFDQGGALERRTRRQGEPTGRRASSGGLEWVAQEELTQVLERVNVLRADVTAVDVERVTLQSRAEAGDGKRQIGDGLLGARLGESTF